MIEVEIEGIDTLLDYFQSMDVRRAIDRGLKKSMLTLENEAKKATPVDTGLLRNSYETTFSSGSAVLNNFREYAIYVQDGTKYMAGRDFMGTAVSNSVSSIQKIFEGEVEILVAQL